MDQVTGGGDSSRPPSCAEKVAFSIFKYFPYGGLQLDMMRLAREFAARNREVIIYCMGYDIDEIPAGVTFRKLDVKGMSNHAKARNFAKVLAAELPKSGCKIHIAFNRLTPADWYFAADMPFEESNKRSFLKKLMPRYRIFAGMEKDLFTPENDTRVLCMTDRQMRDYQRIYGTPAERMFVLPPGIDDSFASAWKLRENREQFRNELGVNEDETLIIQISSTFATKGVDRSIAALASLPEHIRKKSRLLIVGRGKTAPFAKFAASCGVRDQVIFAGARDDIPELIAAADLMIHPARSEASGAVLLEALACGTPVLCSANCGFASIVKEAGGLVLPRRFRQKLLNRTLMVTLSTPDKLADLQQAAENYGRNGDFYRRAKVAADLIMQDLLENNEK